MKSARARGRTLFDSLPSALDRLIGAVLVAEMPMPTARTPRAAAIAASEALFVEATGA